MKRDIGLKPIFFKYIKINLQRLERINRNNTDERGATAEEEERLSRTCTNDEMLLEVDKRGKRVRRGFEIAPSQYFSRRTFRRVLSSDLAFNRMNLLHP